MSIVKSLITKYSFVFILLYLISCNKEDLRTNNSDDISEIQLRSIRNMPTVVSGILKFNNKQHLSEYLDDISTLDEDQLDSLENILGYISLRSKYYQLEMLDTVWRTSQPFIVENPFDGIVFNIYHELWVGDDIYKFIDKNLIATAKSQYLNEILSIRDNNVCDDHIFRLLIEFQKLNCQKL